MILMYHYVYPYGFRKLSKPVFLEQFEEQIYYLKNNYNIIDPNLLNNGNSPPFKNIFKDNSCLITFDDITKDQVTFAAQVLNDFKIKALFFCVGKTLIHDFIPLTHLVHLCIEKQDPKKTIDNLIEKTNIVISDDMILSAKKTYDYEEDMNIALLKYYVNFILLNKIDKSTLNKILSEILDEDTTDPDHSINIFADQAMIEDLINQGHIIGNHSYTHESFDNLNINSCINEIDKCHKIIKKELGITTKYFAYPLGPPKDIIKRKEINIHLKSLKYLCSFGIETTNSIEIDYEFPRLDAGFQFVNLMNHE